MPIDTKPDVGVDRGPDTGATDMRVDIRTDVRTDTGDAGEAGSNCIDLDGDGYGVGSGCAGLDCDDADPSIRGSVDSRNCPAGAGAAKGTCHLGTQSCTAGVWSACIGQVVPSGEACNGEDDDCDGTADDNLPVAMFTCGQGACQNSVPPCSLGTLESCLPHSNLAAADDNSCNGVDDDCDGIVDQNCQAIINACVHVSPNGDDGGDGTTGAPYRTIQMAIAKAFNPTGTSQAVCVAGGATCQDHTTYTVGDTTPFQMSNGVSVYGNYEAATWTRCPIDDSGALAPTVTIELKEAGGVRFMNTVNLPTTLDGFVLARNVGGSPATIAAVTVNGAKQVRLANLVVNDGAAASSTIGVNLVSSGEATITHSLIFGGAGTTQSIGVSSVTSKPTIIENCLAIDPTTGPTSGRCITDCNKTPPPTLGIFGRAGAAGMGVGTGVLLNASPGASIETSTICGGLGTDAIGVHIVSDATGTMVHGSSISASGGSNNSVGILAEDCNAATPWIVGNSLIQGQQGTTRAAGIVARGACKPVIDFNTLVSGGGDSTTGLAVGVSCESNIAMQSSLCAVLGNEGIQGSGTARTAQSIGVACLDRSCVRVADNSVKGSSAVTAAFGVVLRNDGTMVERNRITGGCGQVAVGLRADDSFARVQNNLITAGNCTGAAITASPTNIGLHILGASDQNEMDIDSNTIDGGGNAGVCAGIAVALGTATGVPAPTAPKGILRNNILTGGACTVATTGGSRTDFAETAATTDPRIFQNNDLDSTGTLPPTQYLDEGTTVRTAAAVNTLTDITTGGNISVPPMFMSQTGDLSTSDLHLLTGSACKAAGTPTGAPTTDIEGTPRSTTKPSIGAYE